MAKNNVKNFITFPFNEVFSERVYVDANNNVIYDMVMGVAIAFIHKTITHMYIGFVLPEITDNNFEDERISLSAYFNAENVVEKDFDEFYFRVKDGYYYLGHPYKNTNYQIRLPRLYDPDDATNTFETGSAAIEEIDEDDIDLIDPEEFAPDVDDMIERLIH